MSSKSVILCLGRGDLVNGCPDVSIELLDSDNRSVKKKSCSLPADTELLDIYKLWQLGYRDYYQLRGWYSRGGTEEDDADPDEYSEAAITNFSDRSGEDLLALGEELITRFNKWLRFPPFNEIEMQLRTRLGSASAKFCLVVETEDEQLRQLPWERWGFVEDYPEAGVARGNLDRNRLDKSPITKTRKKVRILCIIGNSENIDTNSDRKQINQIADAIPTFLDEPKAEQLKDRLWEKGCDVLFFAGHSSSEYGGCIKLNQKESLTIKDLRTSLTKAIENNLKLAIFNSCDGLKLARDLADLHIPAVIVMRQPVPDAVAQKFLRYFLQNFSSGDSLDASVRKATKRLQEIEKDYPCASLLPTLVWNRAEELPRWQDWRGRTWRGRLLIPGWRNRAPTGWEREIRTPSIGQGIQTAFIASLLATSLVMGVRWLGNLEPLEMVAYDNLMSRRPSKPVDPRLLLIEVTDKDTQLEAYGYPVNDATIAEALKIIEQNKPRAIALDMHRYVAREPGHKQLIDRFRQNPNIFTVCAFGYDGKNVIPPPPELSKEPLSDRLGFSDLETDARPINSANVVRRQLLSYDADRASSSLCPTPYSLSFLLAYTFLDAEGKPLTVTENGEWQSDKVVFKPLTARTGGYQGLDGLSTQILLNYHSNPYPAVKFSISDVLEKRVPGHLIKDKIVLIGYTAAIAKDNFDTPHGNIPGVWIHAHMVSQILSAVIDKRQQIWVLPQLGDLQWGDALWVWSWSFIVGLLICRCTTPAYLILVCGVTIWILQQVCLVILTYGGWMPFIPSVLSLMVTGGLVVYTRDIKGNPYLKS